MVMKAKTIPAVEARTHFGEIIAKSCKSGQRFIVEKSGIPMVVILSAEEYNRIITEREERFKVIDVIRQDISPYPPDAVRADIEKAIKAIRKAHA